ncbi:HD domain-containing protein [Mesonia aestuariivivens]|uniref:HD domain-containing protein n=1 Tax=Mesonia aestuariivivens TaxID=2796128 RepID=A0ABS6W4W2_9FLAO|nr:HD domain-containing protein [Mesonia aestuariivivens]MBW2962905.1 HD domain-containing protein [Mesonia aestuariivivens]
MESSRLKKQIEFIKEVDKLKCIERKTSLFDSNRRENDAEHSWHLSLMAIILDEHSNENIDVLKVLKMLLIHDIVEIDAGDTFLFDTKKNHDNTAEEFVAAKRIFGILPKNQAEDLITIWKEFEEGETSEAKFAKAMDRFQPVLQNQSNNGGTWFEFNVIYENVIKKTEKIKLGSNTIWEYVEKTIKSLYNR